jgi:outer membrane lipoprotein-sorting protein
MYSKEENQKLKHEFWVEFAQKYPRKWVLYDTKIKDFSFKFYVENTKAQVHIDIEMRNKELRMQYFEKLVSLKNILEDEFIKDLVFERNLTLENGKTISRVWVEKGNVSVSNRKYWDEIFDFFYEKMNALELFYLDYDEFIKDIEK